MGTGRMLARPEQLLPRRPQRPLDQRTFVGRQPGRQRPRALVVVAEAHPPALLRHLVGLGLRRLGLLEGVAAQHPPQLHHRGRSGQLRRLAVDAGGGVAADDRHLVLAQLARLHGRLRLRQLAQPPGHRHQPPGPLGRHAALPRHPLLGRADARPLPCPRLQHLGDEPDQPPGGGVQQPAHLGDLRLNLGGNPLGIRTITHTLIVPNICSIHKSFPKTIRQSDQTVWHHGVHAFRGSN